MSEKKRYELLAPHFIDGVYHKAGKVLSLTDAQKGRKMKLLDEPKQPAPKQPAK